MKAISFFGAFVIVTSNAFTGIARADVAAADCAEPTRNLSLVSPATSNLKHPVQVRFSLVDGVLIADFTVTAKTINAKPTLGPGEYPYQADVVEMFVSVGGDPSHLPYYEFELSPYDNTFEVRVDDLKKPYAEDLRMGLGHSVKRTATGWTGQMTIPLANLTWNGDLNAIVGNAYAIQGVKPNKTYWGLTLPPQKSPNFHKPQFFAPLLSCLEPAR